MVDSSHLSSGQPVSMLIFSLTCDLGGLHAALLVQQRVRAKQRDSVVGAPRKVLLEPVHKLLRGERGARQDARACRHWQNTSSHSAVPHSSLRCGAAVQRSQQGAEEARLSSSCSTGRFP